VTDASAPDPSPPRGTITVLGTGRVTDTPDEAEVQLGVQVVRPSVGEARDEATARLAQVLEALRGIGLPERDLRTSQLSVGPHHEYPPEGGQRFAGYEVINRVAVTVRALDRLPAVVDDAIEAGATTLDGVQFRLSAPEKHERQALAAAVADARARADGLADAAGQRITGVRSITEQARTGPGPMRMARMEVMAADTQVLPGSTETTATVSVVFSVEPVTHGGQADRGRRSRAVSRS
jgi:uncharacterized protein YggE